jgi:hypothetical protein
VGKNKQVRPRNRQFCRAFIALWRSYRQTPVKAQTVFLSRVRPLSECEAPRRKSPSRNGKYINGMPYKDRAKYLECCRLAGRRWYRRNHQEQLRASRALSPFPMPPEVKAADQALLKDAVFSFFGAQRYFEDIGEEYSGEGAAPFVRGLSPQIAESRFLYQYRSLS